MRLTEPAYTKINLALHVRARRPDGYHHIETLFAFCADGDVLTGEPGHGAFAVRGPFAGAIDGAVSDNLVVRAVAAFAPARPIDVTLEKRLPVAAGIGGGSADAAAVLRLLARCEDVALDDPRLLAISGALGADVPACLTSCTVRGEGRGDSLSPVPAEGLSGMPVLLVNPRVPLATGPVFAGWDGIDRGPLPQGDPLAVALAGRNDLEPPAIALRPIIADVLLRLRGQAGVTLARMSGSGATCFALFERQADRDAAVRAMDAAWWCLATELR